MDFSRSLFSNGSRNDSIMNQSDVLLFHADGAAVRQDLTQVWILSLLCSSLVGFTGLVPFIILPKDLNSCESLSFPSECILIFFSSLPPTSLIQSEINARFQRRCPAG